MKKLTRIYHTHTQKKSYIRTTCSILTSKATSPRLFVVLAYIGLIVPTCRGPEKRWCPYGSLFISRIHLSRVFGLDIFSVVVLSSIQFVVFLSFECLQNEIAPVIKGIINGYFIDGLGSLKDGSGVTIVLSLCFKCCGSAMIRGTLTLLCTCKIVTIIRTKALCNGIHLYF